MLLICGVALLQPAFVTAEAVSLAQVIKKEKLYPVSSPGSPELQRCLGATLINRAMAFMGLSGCLTPHSEAGKS